jgi:hypothetical protein
VTNLLVAICTMALLTVAVAAGLESVASALALPPAPPEPYTCLDVTWDGTLPQQTCSERSI